MNPPNPKIRQVNLATHPPTLEGPAGCAWEIDLEALALRNLPGFEPNHTTVSSWLVYAPAAHPFWSYYEIAAIHLRDVPGMKPATIMRPGSTHEVMLYALSPEIAPDPKGFLSVGWLKPMNFGGQWTVAVRPNPVDLDNAARSKIRGTVEEILAGVLNPDTDGIRQWIDRFSDSNRLQ